MKLEDKTDIFAPKGRALLKGEVAYRRTAEFELSIVVGDIQQSKNVQECGLAGPGMTDDRDKTAFVDNKIQVLEYFQPIARG